MYLESSCMVLNLGKSHMPLQPGLMFFRLDASASSGQIPSQMKSWYKRTNTTPLSQEIKRRRWIWIYHVCRMHPTSIPRVALRWTPTGKRKWGRAKETWRCSVEKEMKEKDWTWGQVQHWSQDRQA